MVTLSIPGLIAVIMGAACVGIIIVALVSAGRDE